MHPTQQNKPRKINTDAIGQFIKHASQGQTKHYERDAINASMLFSSPENGIWGECRMRPQQWMESSNSLLSLKRETVVSSWMAIGPNN